MVVSQAWNSLPYVKSCSCTSKIMQCISMFTRCAYQAQPWCNTQRLTGLKTPANKQAYQAPDLFFFFTGKMLNPIIVYQLQSCLSTARPRFLHVKLRKYLHGCFPVSCLLRDKITIVYTQNWQNISSSLPVVKLLAIHVQKSTSLFFLTVTK